MPSRTQPPMTFGRAQPRNASTGQYERLPKDPEEVLKAGGTPAHWAPGLGVGTAPGKSGEIPWPAAKQPPTPFRNLKQGR